LVSEQTACRINPRDIFTWWSDPPPAWPEAERRWLARLLADIGRISYLSVIGLMEEAILAVGIVELLLALEASFYARMSRGNLELYVAPHGRAKLGRASPLGPS
jgi:hypothetical protein